MEEDSGPKPDEEKETKSPAEEDAGMTGEISDANPSLGHTAWFANAGELYQKKNHNWFGCGSPQPPGEGLPKRTGENHEEGRFKLKRGDGEEGRLILSKVGDWPTGHPRQCSPSIETSRKASFLNTDPLTCWSGPENIAQIKINDEGSWALLDSGSTINTVTPEFIKAHSLDVGPLSNLVYGTLKISGFGGLFSWPLGYVMIRVQVEGVKGYNEDQVALVIPDLTAFGLRVPATLGTPTFNWIMNIIKESEIDELPVSLSGSRISYLLAGHQVELSLKNNTIASPIPDPTDLNEAV